MNRVIRFLLTMLINYFTFVFRHVRQNKDFRRLYVYCYVWAWYLFCDCRVCGVTYEITCWNKGQEMIYICAGGYGKILWSRRKRKA